MADTDQTNRTSVSLTSLLVSKMGMIFREQMTSDYGIDAHIEIKDGSSATGRLIAAQIKGGESYFTNESDTGFWLSVSDRHKQYWADFSLPVVVILCNIDDNKCYYECATDATFVRAGENWKILVPKEKVLDVSCLHDLLSIATPVVAASDFTICAEEDLSHANARRISLEIIAHPANKSLNKPLLGAIIRTALKQGQESQYYRDDISAAALAGRDVDVVWGYLYLREIDRQSASWVCRFQWIAPSLEPAFRPLPLSGEEDESGLVIDWNGNSQVPKLMDERRATKADYLRRVDLLLAQLPFIERTLTEVIKNDDRYLMSSELEAGAKAFEDMWDGSFAAPMECQRLDQAINELLATVGNAGLIWRNRQARDDKQVLFLLNSYQRELVRLGVEIPIFRQDVR